MAGKKKFYVVWQGVEPGIYESWAATQAQINGYPGARYRSYSTRAAAEEAYVAGPDADPPKKAKAPKPTADPNDPAIIWKSISVDAACSGNPGPMEYQGVDTATGDRIFHQQFPLGTNNIGEFLAIVHALALLQRQGQPDLPIYTDSRIALGWVKRKAAKTKLVRNARTAKLYQLIDRAETWLKNNTYSNPILKWNTETWGEIPADFGRK